MARFVDVTNSHGHEETINADRVILIMDHVDEGGRNVIGESAIVLNGSPGLTVRGTPRDIAAELGDFFEVQATNGAKVQVNAALVVRVMDKESPKGERIFNECAIVVAGAPPIPVHSNRSEIKALLESGKIINLG